MLRGAAATGIRGNARRPRRTRTSSGVQLPRRTTAAATTARMPWTSRSWLPKRRQLTHTWTLRGTAVPQSPPQQRMASALVPCIDWLNWLASELIVVEFVPVFLILFFLLVSYFINWGPQGLDLILLFFVLCLSWTSVKNDSSWKARFRSSNHISYWLFLSVLWWFEGGIFL